jgi:hypothetical protein
MIVKVMCQTPGEIINLKNYSDQNHGGLIIVGSHVKKTVLNINLFSFLFRNAIRQVAK